VEGSNNNPPRRRHNKRFRMAAKSKDWSLGPRPGRLSHIYPHRRGRLPPPFRRPAYTGERLHSDQPAPFFTRGRGP
jgi:hypothetical protein